MHEMKEVSHIFASEPHFDIVDCAALPESGVDTSARRTDSFKWLGKMYPANFTQLANLFEM